jgi:F-type H+-transporting ATPase subunit b
MNILDILIPVARAAEGAAKAEQESGILGKLGIHGELFIMQLINFAIILAVLWKWVFPAVAKKLQERSERIEKAMLDAQTITREKTEFDAWKQEEMSKVRKEAAELVAQAQREAVRSKEEILAATKIDQEKMITQAKAHIEEEEKRMLSDAKAHLADLVVGASEKILRAKLDKASDKKLIEESLQHVTSTKY